MKYLPFLSLLLLGLPLVVFGQQDPGFVPLTTGVPFLENVGNADSLSAFLNDIYKVCIGVAATLAVLQIMRAGIMYMGGDSVTEKKEAKNLIAMSIGGLILVLSPVVVFSIINPEILNLEIKGLKDLASDVEGWGLSEEARENTLDVNTTDTRPVAKAACIARGGTPVFTCTPRAGGSGRTVPESELCNAATELSATVCTRNETTATSESCTGYTGIKDADGGLCTTEGYTRIGDSCCASGVCCGSRSGAVDDPARTSFFSIFRGIEEEANRYVAACDALRPSAGTQDIVMRRHGTKVQVPRAIDTETRQNLFYGICESYSLPFIKYAVVTRGVSEAKGFAPGEEDKYNRYFQGCRNNPGGTFQDEWSGTRREGGPITCPADIKTRIEASLGPPPTEGTRTISCTQVTFRCIKP
ncbi:MAG: hypothetical protein QG636_370 [Patescibacteria group bacterium]|nr:hypothetical protein [Patescibacteria group bacterium]